MSESCPVLTPAERTISGILDRSEQMMMAAIYQAIEDATNQTAEGLRSAGVQHEPPAHDYFASVAQQQLFLSLCRADPETFEGGDPEAAAHIITNYQNISDHYWSKKGAEPA